jgi:hypothetical protein
MSVKRGLSWRSPCGLAVIAPSGRDVDVDAEVREEVAAACRCFVSWVHGVNRIVEAPAADAAITRSSVAGKPIES